MNLAAHLGQRGVPATRVIAGPERWTAEDLVAAAACNPLLAARACERVALCLRDPLKFVVSLLALDGQCASITLLSPDLPDGQLSQLVDAAGCELVLADRPITVSIPVTDWPGPVCRGANAPPGLAAVRDTRWLMSTSGTTGTPKLVDHTLSSLTRLTSRSDAISQLRWGQFYDQSRQAGIQVLLQALVGGGSLVLPDAEDDLPRKLALFAASGVTAASATPTLWRKILMSPASQGLRLDQVTLGGEIVDDAILASLARRFPHARISHIFASTEAGAAFAVTDGRAGFPAAYLDDPPKGVRLAIRDGTLWVGTDRPARSYLGTAHSYSDRQGFVDTGDRVRIERDRCYFEGRANGMINVGGNKLCPEEVEGVLLSHPAVRFVRIGTAKSPITGQIVRAEVVPALADLPAAELRKTLGEFCASRLPKWKCPAIYRFVDELDVSFGGKLARTVA